MRCTLPDPAYPERACGTELPCVFHGDASRRAPASAWGPLNPTVLRRDPDTDDHAANAAAAIMLSGGVPVMNIHLGQGGAVAVHATAAPSVRAHGYGVYHQLWAWLWDVRPQPFPPKGMIHGRFTYDCRRAYVFDNLISAKAQIYALGVDPREDFTLHGFDVLRVR